MDHWLRSFVGQVISQRDNGNEHRTDFLQQILDARVKSKIDEESVAGHALTFLLEGFETSSITLTYCLYEVSKMTQNYVALYFRETILYFLKSSLEILILKTGLCRKLIVR